MPYTELLDRSWYGATLTQWLSAAATLAGVYIALAVLRRLFVRRLGTFAARTTTHWDDLVIQLVDRTRWYFLLLVAGYAATRVAPLPPDIARVLGPVAVIVVLVQTGVWGNGIIGFAADYYVRLRASGDLAARATIHAIGYAGRFVLWSLLVLTALQHFGIRITALLTGLGIGGIAVALAVQNILGDLFAALAIVLDKPFLVGETIHVDNIIGTVEHVGLKTTRLRSLSGEQVIISNNDLLKSRIRNYKRMHERRAVFTLDVAHDTPAAKVSRIPQIVREAVAAQPLTRLDRCHFLSFAESSLRIETVYFVLDPDYAKYADIQQSINLELLRRFDVEGIKFAFPSRTVFLRGANNEPAQP